jgi:hypothetical protein
MLQRLLFVGVTGYILDLPELQIKYNIMTSFTNHIYDNRNWKGSLQRR